MFKNAIGSLAGNKVPNYILFFSYFLSHIFYPWRFCRQCCLSFSICWSFSPTISRTWIVFLWLPKGFPLCLQHPVNLLGYIILAFLCHFLEYTVLSSYVFKSFSMSKNIISLIMILNIYLSCLFPFSLSGAPIIHILDIPVYLW